MMKSPHRYALVLAFLLVPNLLFAEMPTAPSPEITNAEEKSALITQLLAQIESLRAQLKEIQSASGGLHGDPASSTKRLLFGRVLTLGMSGDDVRALQQALAVRPDIYPEGLITGYYGTLTERAVKQFQKLEGIVGSGTPETTGYGQVGPLTLPKINELMLSGTHGSGGLLPSLSSPTIAVNSSTTSSAVQQTPAPFMGVVSQPIVTPPSLGELKSTSTAITTPNSTNATTEETSPATSPVIIDGPPPPAVLPGTIGSIVHQLTGVIKSIEGSTVTLTVLYPKDPLGDPSLSERVISVNNSTVVTIESSKDRAVYDKEIAEYAVEMEKYKEASLSGVGSLIPPPMVTITDVKIGTVSSLAVGQRISVNAEENIKTKKSFVATKVNIIKLISAF